MSITEFISALDPMALGFLAGCLTLLVGLGWVLYDDIDLGPETRDETPPTNPTGGPGVGSDEGGPSPRRPKAPEPRRAA